MKFPNFKQLLLGFKKIGIAIWRTINENESAEQVIETIMVLLIIAIMALALLDTFLINNIRFTQFVEVFDLIVCVIFAADLIKRYCLRGGSRLNFFKKSWLEIIAIIPFDVVFRFLRIARVFRVLRFGKVGRLSIVSKLGRFGNTFMKFSQTITRNPFLSFMKSSSYIRYKRFNKLLMGYGKSKAKGEELESASENIDDNQNGNEKGIPQVFPKEND